MKTYKTSEAIAILESDPTARFEAPETDALCRQMIDSDDNILRFFWLVRDDANLWPDTRPALRSDWVRTDKAEE